MNVLFLGGSNTWGDAANCYAESYAAKTAAYLQNRFPNTNIFNAAVCGTGTRLCAFQVERLVEESQPDVVFIEYSINDSGLALKNENQVLADTEYVVRTILKVNPKAYILMLMFAKKDFMSCTKTHIKIAEHYGLDYIELQEPMRKLTKNAEAWYDYFADSVHPNSRGHQFYFDHIQAFLDSKSDDSFVRNSRIPDAYLPCIYNAPKIVPADLLLQHPAWTKTTYKDAKHWDGVKIDRYLHCNTVEVPATFRFTGHTFGIYHLVRSDCGKLQITVDDQEYVQDGYFDCDGDFVSFFNIYDLPYGEHTVTIKILKESNPKSIGVTAGICGFLID